ncbi:hypothetical protein SY83_14325 [Paenibacillus swuensis]|uniref:Uncharacterized protein n=1 Tax=Paenibacillus swuensis TaxID=1178515 RepID=A0A172TJP3_9BACL|nr:hypothetical protein [Paenibacillus swuensis]ANE47248.1 hypothetical protein SY83_14325 [Paenibacillus swuensis]
MVRGIIAGLTAGAILGALFKGVEAWTNHLVYVLLLNVDYIPGLRSWITQEWQQFSIHMMLSVSVALSFAYGFHKRGITGRGRILYAVLFSLSLGALLYPTTLLSEVTPSFTDLGAFFWWMTGHALYGWVAGWILSMHK